MVKVGTLQIGGSNPVRVMGILNVSPESFYKKSIKTGKSQIEAAVINMVECGADMIDVGGMSTAPYLSTMISEKEESRRLLHAIKIIQKVSNIPISVDTCRASVARIALELGADAVNDVTGLKYDSNMAKVLERFGPSLVLCAHSKKAKTGDVSETKKILRQSILLAKKAGISHNKIILDPAIGFFRRSGRGALFTRTGSDWVSRDLGVLSNLEKIGGKFPVLVSVSRKSFLGAILGEENPEKRLSGSLACELVSVLHGASVIRTHDIPYTRRIVDLAGSLRSQSL